MCCFSRPIPFVGSTKIFARGTDGGRQLLIYALDVTVGEELAMILPLPVVPGSGESAVSFINLESEETFFSQLAAAFPTFLLAKTRGGPAVRHAPKLQVHDVGQYEASFVPGARDFGRLDERFRLPEGFLAALPLYGDYGFAVFRLKPQKKGWFGGAKRQSVQPMAFTFPGREPRSLFFPTVHVHDGSVPARAQFDHAPHERLRDARARARPNPLFAVQPCSTAPCNSDASIKKRRAAPELCPPSFLAFYDSLRAVTE